MRTVESLLVHAVVGSILGSLTSIVSLLLLALPSVREWPPTWMIIPVFFGPMVGAPLGALAGPILGWFLLRRVPVKRIVVFTPLGSLFGAHFALLGGWLFADISDGVGTIFLIGGAIVGVVFTAFVLRARYAHPIDLNPMW